MLWEVKQDPFWRSVCAYSHVSALVIKFRYQGRKQLSDRKQLDNDIQGCCTSDESLFAASLHVVRRVYKLGNDSNEPAIIFP